MDVKGYLKIPAVRFGEKKLYTDIVFNPKKIKLIQDIENETTKQTMFLEKESSLGRPRSLIVLDCDDKFVSCLEVEALYMRLNDLENEYKECIKEKEDKKELLFGKDVMNIVGDQIKNKEIYNEEENKEKYKTKYEEIIKEIWSNRIKNKEQLKREFLKEYIEEQSKKLEEKRKNGVMDVRIIKKYTKMEFAKDMARTIIVDKDIEFLLSKENVLIQSTKNPDAMKDLVCLKFDEILNAKYSDINIVSKNENQITTLYIPASYDEGIINEIFMLKMNRVQRNQFNFIKSCLCSQFLKFGRTVKNFGLSYNTLLDVFERGDKQILGVEDGDT